MRGWMDNTRPDHALVAELTYAVLCDRLSEQGPILFQQGEPDMGVAVDEAGVAGDKIRQFGHVVAG